MKDIFDVLEQPGANRIVINYDPFEDVINIDDLLRLFAEWECEWPGNPSNDEMAERLSGKVVHFEITSEQRSQRSHVVIRYGVGHVAKGDYRGVPVYETRAILDVLREGVVVLNVEFSSIDTLFN